MLFKTHLALGFLGALFFLPDISYKLIFFPVVIFACLLPDIDSVSSKLGQYRILRPFQWFLTHRGLLHSFTFCIFISILLSLFLPRVAFPFFLGYSIHLLADSVTSDGIRPWWPSKQTHEGRIRTGGTVEAGLFYGIVLADILLFIRLFV